ncbi:hypothetical protein CYMTET_29472 [Cymbomonas tetramitiformis]|uniref:Uncharacterized protein n=1 Tax=Cymbomonas tetramitiformis TaxID=36881 RepID=A0AAE0FL11_9CHLO|nr:hypothetical protein CYMTET_29472 [Cymbomonas tetramitiformis]
MQLEESYGTGAELGVMKLGGHPGTAQLDLDMKGGREVKAGEPPIAEGEADPPDARTRRTPSLRVQTSLAGRHDENGLYGENLNQASATLSLSATSEAGVDNWQGRGQPVIEARQDDTEKRQELREIHRLKLPKRVHSGASVDHLGGAQYMRDLPQLSSLLSGGSSVRMEDILSHTSEWDPLGPASLSWQRTTLDRDINSITLDLGLDSRPQFTKLDGGISIPFERMMKGTADPFHSLPNLPTFPPLSTLPSEDDSSLNWSAPHAMCKQRRKYTWWVWGAQHE